MMTLYVQEQGAKIHLSGGRAEIRGPDKSLLGQPHIHLLESVILIGNVQATTPFLQECLKKGISVAYLSQSHRLLGRLVPPGGKDVHRRIRQVQMFTNPEERLPLARSLVSTKIRNSLECLKQTDWDRGHGQFKPVRRELESLVAKAESATSISALRGIEGTAARLYISCFNSLLSPSGISFPGRNRRPPRDPANALLSFAYVLLANRVAARLEADGLDPAIGFYHELSFGRASLALDLIDPMRPPIVDRFVVRLLNRKEIKPEDFSQSASNGLRLAKKPLSAFLMKWNGWITEKKLDESIARESLSLRRWIDKTSQLRPAFMEFAAS